MPTGDNRMSLLEPPVEKPQKSRVMLFTIAALALTLSGVGLVGVLGYFVNERAPEIGIRR